MRYYELLKESPEEPIGHFPLLSSIHQFIDDDEENDEEIALTTEQLAELATTIKQGCSQILAVYNAAGSFLFRGIKSHYVAFYQHIHAERRPMHLEQEYHDLFNTVLREQGFVAHRGNSAFATPNERFAKAWGTKESPPFVIFPLNGFQFTWFEYQNPAEYVYNVIDRVVRPMYPGTPPPSHELKDRFSQIIKELSPRKDRLDLAISLNREVLISGQGYYAITQELLTLIENMLF